MVQALIARPDSGRPGSFRQLVADCHTRMDVIVHFLALLELCKMGRVSRPGSGADLRGPGRLPGWPATSWPGCRAAVAWPNGRLRGRRVRGMSEER